VRWRLRDLVRTGAHLAPAALLIGCGGPPSELPGDPEASRDSGAGDAGEPIECDPLAPVCPAGHGCYWAAPGRFECAASLGLPRYHLCEASAQCSPGDGCHLDDRFDFFCIGYCDHARYGGERDPERCGENELCGDFDGEVGRCLGICDPLASDCPDGLGCYAILDGAADLCLPVTGEGQPGEPCQKSNDCAPGSGCVELGDQLACATYCDHDENPGQADPRCAGGEVCTPLQPGERIGACAAPG